MDNAAKTILVVPLLAVFHIILAVAGCIAVFFVIRSSSERVGGFLKKITSKAKLFGREVKDEADRLKSLDGSTTQ